MFQLCQRHGYSDSQKGVLIHKRVPFSLHTTICDSEGRFTIVTGKLMGHNVALVCVYAPNTDCPDFFHSLYAQLVKLDSVLLIVGGDFNLLLNPALDGTSKSPDSKPRARRALLDLCDQLSLLDIRGPA